MDGYGFQGAMPPFYSSSHDYEMSWNRNKIYGGMEPQVSFPNFANSRQGYFQESSSQAFISQPQWCLFCGGNHFAENCYTLYPTNHVPQQPAQTFEMESMRDNMFMKVSSQLDELQAQLELMLAHYQDFPIQEKKSTETSELMQLYAQFMERQAQADHEMTQWQDLTIQEPLQDSFNEEVLEELLLPNESHEVERNRKDGEDLERDDDEVIDECIEMETPSWEESVELQGIGDIEHMDSCPLDEEVFDGAHDLNEDVSPTENTSLGENFREILNSGGIGVLKNDGIQLPMYISNDSQFLLVHVDDPRLSSLFEQEDVENGGIILDLGECGSLHDDMKGSILKEFIDGHHLKKYLKDKIDGKKGIFNFRSFDG